MFLIGLLYPLKKKEKILWNHHQFLFLLLWLIPHKTTVKKKVQRNLQTMSYNTHTKKKKKKVNFIYNQLECFFFFFFSSKTKYIYDFLKPKSQTPKYSKANHNLYKIHNIRLQHQSVSFLHLNKKNTIPLPWS